MKADPEETVLAVADDATGVSAARQGSKRETTVKIAASTAEILAYSAFTFPASSPLVRLGFMGYNQAKQRPGDERNLDSQRTIQGLYDDGIAHRCHDHRHPDGVVGGLVFAKLRTSEGQSSGFGTQHARRREPRLLDRPSKALCGGCHQQCLQQRRLRRKRDSLRRRGLRIL